MYQSRKRGMLENDLLLSTFAAKYLEKFTNRQIEQYDRYDFLWMLYFELKVRLCRTT